MTISYGYGYGLSPYGLKPYGDPAPQVPMTSVTMRMDIVASAILYRSTISYVGCQSSNALSAQSIQWQDMSTD